MRKATLLAATTVLSLALLAAAGRGAASSASERTGRQPSRLQSFGSCSQLLGYAKQHLLPLVGPWGLGGGTRSVPTGAPATGDTASGAAGSGGQEFSSTNVQESGVDEPDLVKSNGANLFVVRGGQLFSVDVRGPRPRVVGSLELPPAGSYELLLYGERLLALSRGGGFVGPVPGVGAPELMPIRLARSSLIEIDVGDPAAPRIVRSLVLDADLVSARLVGPIARVVAQSQLPQALAFVRPADPTPESNAAARARNVRAVKVSRVRSWLPSYAVGGRRGETLSRRLLVRCRDVRRTAQYSGLGLLTVLTIDLRKGLAPVDSESVLAGGRTVYASQGSLYVATERWFAEPLAGSKGAAPETTTAIHKFDISDAARTVYRGSGTVPGFLLSQWSLSELGGVLRVASTAEPPWSPTQGQGSSESFVTTLREREGTLVQIGQAGGLGKGERVRAVRFIGDTGYVVTFRQVDPLYTLDLSDPARPAVLGELKLLGYSAYLHPVGDDLLLGIGQDATAEGRTLGTQLSLFDVSDSRRPIRLQARPLGPGWSEAESDHHAFLWWGPARLAVLPLQSYAGAPFVGAVGFRVGRTGIAEVVRVGHPPAAGSGHASRQQGAPVRRSLVVGDDLYTVSDAGVAATSLATFAADGWAAFPQNSPAGAAAR